MQVVYDISRNAIIFGDWSKSKGRRHFCQHKEMHLTLTDPKDEQQFIYGYVEGGVLEMSPATGEIARLAFGPNYKGRRKAGNRKLTQGEAKYLFRTISSRVISLAIGNEKYRFMTFPYRKSRYGQSTQKAKVISSEYSRRQFISNPERYGW